MFKHKIFGLFFLLLTTVAFSATATASEAYIGQFLYQYKGGNTYRVISLDHKTMQWECIEGSEKGAKGIETPERFKINSTVFFTTWVEKTGINVSQVVDLKKMKVYSTIVDGKDRYVLEGNVVREK
jgi:phenolic acid decarboxylase